MDEIKNMINEIKEEILQDVIDLLDLLCKAKNNLCLEDYINIWGEQLGNHIWRQEGLDLLRIWTSGLNSDQRIKFIIYIRKKYGK